jgi:Lar family restriction alleviation protein
MTEDPRLKELKPCPFCGGKANYDFEKSDRDPGYGKPLIDWEVYCMDCFACVSATSERRAKELWNRRVASEA